MMAPAMSRTTLNFWLDLVSFLVMLGLAMTGGITHFVLPAGTGHSCTLFGLGRHDYGQIHFYLAVAAVLLVALHVALHWAWVCCVVAKSMGKGQPSRRSQTLWGVVVLGGCGLLLGVGLWWASAQIERRPTLQPRHEDHGVGLGANDRGTSMPDAPLSGAIPGSSPAGDTQARSSKGTLDKHEEACPQGAIINGRTTLQEVAAAAGLTVDAVLRELKVTSPADPQQQLGRLKRELGFSIHDVRKLVCRSR